MSRELPKRFFTKQVSVSGWCPESSVGADPQDNERFADQRNYPLEGESAGGETRRNLGPRMEDAALDYAATPGTGAIDPGRLQLYHVGIGSPITGTSGRGSCT